jgi:hypothetical protein
MKLGLGAETDASGRPFVRKYRAEMATPAASQSLDVLARFRITPIFRWGVIARTRSGVTDRNSANC